MTIAARCFEVVGVVGFVGFFYWFIARPWRRERRVTNDGLLCLVCWTMFWHDTLTNYLVHYTTYNAAFFNLGSWDRHIPGWSSPHGNLVIEPTIFVCSAYMWVVFGGVLIGSGFMRRVRSWRPETSNLQLVAAHLPLLRHLRPLRRGQLHAARFLDLPRGDQGAHDLRRALLPVPLYEPLLFGATWTGFTCLRYFRNDRGQSSVERGSEELRTGQGRRTFLRFLALAGACNAIFIVTYDLPINIIAVNGSAWPHDIKNRSYLTDHLCGPGTDAACPGETIPFPHRGSDYVGVTGDLVRGDR